MPLREAQGVTVDSRSAPDGSPVALYLALPGDTEAKFIHRAIPDGAEILELGCGAGRITRHLVELGHAVTAVDNGPAMLEQLEDIDDVETVLADIQTLDLAPRRWPVVLLASHLVNDADGELLLGAAVRHVEAGGSILIQRHEPGWIDSVEESISRRPGLIIDMTAIEHPRPGVMSATMVYEIGASRFEQSFTAFEMDDARLERLAGTLGCVVDETLDEEGKWVRLCPDPKVGDGPASDRLRYLKR